MPLKARDVINALEKKGFQRGNSKDVRFIYYMRNGKKGTRSTMVSHGEREIDERLLGKMSRQMAISREQLGQFVECTLTQDAYEELAEGSAS